MKRDTTSGNLIIRNITFLDLMPLLKLAKEFYDEAEHASYLGFDAQQLCDNLLGIIGSPDFHCKLAIKNNQPIGFILGMVIKEIWSIKSIGYIHCFYVQKAERSLSVANQLYVSFEKWCKGRSEDVGLLQIGLHSGIERKKSAEIYFKRKGFKVAGLDMIKEIV